MAEGIVYLRPSADISVGHSIYPSSLSNAYLAINEVESDGSATYIYQGANMNGSSNCTSQFALSGDCRNVGSVLGGSIVVKGDKSSATCYVKIYLIIGGIEYTVCDQTNFSGDAASFALPENCITAINNANSLTDIQLKFYSSAGAPGSKNTVRVYFTQIYLELTVDYLNTDIGIHKKVNGEWKAATAAFRKSGGVWAEITADECKAYLANAPIVTK